MANESGGHSATSVVSINVMLMDTANAKTYTEEEGMFSGLSNWFLPAAAIVFILLVVMGTYIINRAEEATTVEKLFNVDNDIEAVVAEAESVE